jgi:hypothetical protein
LKAEFADFDTLDRSLLLHKKLMLSSDYFDFANQPKVPLLSTNIKLKTPAEAAHEKRSTKTLTNLSR